MQVLYRPTALDKLCRQPIKKVGVRGLSSGSTEVVRSDNDPSAKVMLPYAIGHDSGRQRIAPVYQPPREFDSASSAVLSQYLSLR